MAASCLLKLASVCVVLLLSTVLAGRLDELSRRKGFHPQALRDLELRSRGLSHEITHKRRYYNEKTKGSAPGHPKVDTVTYIMPADYFVSHLPDIPQSFLSEMYSGLIPIDESDPSRALFFVFQPRIGGPPVDEVTIWFNGG